MLFENPNRRKWKSVGHHVESSASEEEEEEEEESSEDQSETEEENESDSEYRIVTDKLGNTLKIKIEE